MGKRLGLLHELFRDVKQHHPEYPREKRGKVAWAIYRRSMRKKKWE